MWRPENWRNPYSEAGATWLVDKRVYEEGADAILKALSHLDPLQKAQLLHCRPDLRQKEAHNPIGCGGDS